MIVCHQHHLHLRINQDHLTFFFLMTMPVMTTSATFVEKTIS